MTNGGKLKNNKHVAVVLAAAILASGGGVSASVITAEPAQAASTQPEIDAAIAQILKDTNAARAQAGLPPLTLAPTINTVAQDWTEHMAVENYYAHNPSYLDQMHPDWQGAAENIAQGYRSSTVVNAWMNSPGHRANILGDFTHIGLGYWVDNNGRAWFTQNFGKYPNTDTPLSIIYDPVITPSTNEIMAVWHNFNNDYITNYTAEIYASTGQLVESKSIPTKDIEPYAAPSYVFKGLNPNTPYTVKLTAHSDNVMGVRKSSPVRTVQVETTTVPSPPTMLNVTPFAYNSSGVLETLLSWKAPTDIVGSFENYTVTVKTAGHADRVLTTHSTSLPLNDLKENTDYTVEVVTQVLHTDGRSRVVSPAATIALQTPVASAALVSAPTDVIASGITHNAATMTWKAPTDIVGNINSYNVEVSPGPGQNYSNSYTVTGTSHKLLGLAPNHRYTITVKAHATSLDGTSVATSAGTAITLTTAPAPVLSPIVKVAAPVVTIGGVNSDRLTASWAKPAVTGSIKGYKVTVKLGTRIVQTHNLSSTTQTKQLLGLAENSTYTVSVQAIAVAPNGINTATALTVKSVKTTLSAGSTVRVAAPVGLVTAASRTAVTAFWKKPAVTGRVVNYTVRLKQGTRVIKTVVTTSGKYSFTGLRASTVYGVYVTANAVSANGKYKASATASKAVTTLR